MLPFVRAHIRLRRACGLSCGAVCVDGMFNPVLIELRLVTDRRSDEHRHAAVIAYTSPT